jgi:hypothetical protein
MVLVKRTDIKRCTLCKIVKPIDRFYFSDGKHKYRKSRCKTYDVKRKVKHQQYNKVEYYKKHKLWRDNNRDNVRLSCGKAAVNHCRILRQNVLESIGKGKIECAKCGFNDVRAIQIDHINGGGVAHFKSSISSTSYYSSMLYELEKYQLLCANCNSIKRYENKERCSKYIGY